MSLPKFRLVTTVSLGSSFCSLDLYIDTAFACPETAVLPPRLKRLGSVLLMALGLGVGCGSLSVVTAQPTYTQRAWAVATGSGTAGGARYYLDRTVGPPVVGRPMTTALPTRRELVGFQFSRLMRWSLSPFERLSRSLEQPLPSLDPEILSRDSLWLEAIVNGSALTPLQKPHAVPRAFRAERAALADNALHIPVPPGVSVSAGVLMFWANDSPPARWLLCDGSAVSRTAYAHLFAVLGTQLGFVDGASTFNLPDSRGRLILGQDGMGGSAAGPNSPTGMEACRVIRRDREHFRRSSLVLWNHGRKYNTHLG